MDDPAILRAAIKEYVEAIGELKQKRRLFINTLVTVIQCIICFVLGALIMSL